MTPTWEIEVSGTRRSVALTAAIDTGFDGTVSVPLVVAGTLGLELRGEDWVELADGSLKRELRFQGSVRFLGKTQEVSMFLTDSDEALIGTALLAGCRLTIDFDTGNVRLVRKPPRRSQR